MADKNTSKTNQSAQELDSDFHKGKSTFNFPNGDKYSGGYCAHRSGVVWREGQGTYTTKDGQVYSGLWVDDKLAEDEQIEIKKLGAILALTALHLHRKLVLVSLVTDPNRVIFAHCYYAGDIAIKVDGKFMEVCEDLMQSTLTGVQRFPSGAEYYGGIVDNKYTGSAMYVIEKNINLLCELAQNKPTGELLLLDVNGEEWHGTAGDTNAVLLPEHAFFKAISSDTGKGRLRKKKSPLKKTINKVKGKQPKRDQEEENRDIMKELELKIFAKTKKTVSDLKFEESEWYQKYLKFKTLFEEITDRVENEGVDSLDTNQREWYENYLNFKKKYLEIMEHRRHKEKNLSDYKLFELYNSDEYRNSCPPIPVFYPSEVVADDEQTNDETEPPEKSLNL